MGMRLGPSPRYVEELEVDTGTAFGYKPPLVNSLTACRHTAGPLPAFLEECLLLGPDCDGLVIVTQCAGPNEYTAISYFGRRVTRSVVVYRSFRLFVDLYGGGVLLHAWADESVVVGFV